VQGKNGEINLSPDSFTEDHYRWGKTPLNSAKFGSTWGYFLHTTIERGKSFSESRVRINRVNNVEYLAACAQEMISIIEAHFF
jgi:hypothetical protein